MFKSILKLFGEIFGAREFSKSDGGQNLMNSCNDLTDAMGIKSHIFLTKKDKEKMEENAVREYRENVRQNAEFTKEIVKQLEEINRKL